ncbi:hypothetical protein SAMN05216559_3636 [Halomicrobium zhouii]|uniref:Type IV secretory pathway, VirB4 component n=1 Tax=Halomicrobium zhouii TaxID=767519 RepID=A0A1I6M2T5_9EURY|nr:hypothetical protein [Halomicrobium zhouii]SFS09991.1 hypothetical protein SAMN05216559_3636 [Halomicrobium zhouii]
MPQTDSRDPTQLIPPSVNTHIEWYRGVTTQDLLLFVPAGLLAVVALGALYLGATTLAWVAGLLALASAFLAMVGKLTTKWYTSPRERVRDGLSYVRRQRRYPWGPDETVDVHGVRRLDDGIAEMQDGRLVGLVRVDPTNTAMMEQSTKEQLASQLGSVVDEEIKAFDFKLFATTTETDPERLTSEFASRRDGDLDDLDDDRDVALRKRTHLADLVAWRADNHSVWEATDWTFYVAVPVSPSVLRHDVSMWKLLLPFANPENERSDGELEGELRQRIDQVVNGLAGIDGLDAERVAAEEQADLLARFWTDREITDDLRDSLDREESRDNAAVTPAEQAFRPSHLDEHQGFVELNGEYVRTFWIASWPVEPQGLFLQNLVSLRGVDVDLCIHVRSEDKKRKITQLEHQIADIQSEGMERERNADVSAVDVDRDVDAHITYRELLQETPTQPWQISGYVTVRADSRDAAERAEGAVEGFASVDAAQRVALDDAADKVRDRAEANPADLTVIPPSKNQLAALRASSPVGRDHYQEQTVEDKTRSVPGGAIGAMFPFGHVTIEEEGGMEWGRNEQNGTAIKADPFDRGVAPHMMTIGQSRSGKTYGCSKAAARWFMESDEHTLIVCDTQAGFEGLTEQLGGRHYVVDGSKTINPLDIQPVPEYVRESVGQVNPYQMKVNEATQFFAGVLKSQGVDPGSYTSTIEEGLEETYARFDIYPEDLDSHANESPTVADFLETLEDILEHPGEYTHTNHEREIERKVARVSDLLDKLSGFKPSGKYSYLVGQTEESLTDSDLDMAYLDLRQFRGSSDAEKSVMLQLMLGQVYEKVKRSRQKVVFLIDEAHVLLHSERMVTWLQKAAREWARYDAALWFVSQSPREFLSSMQGHGAAEESHRRTIVDQCSTIQCYRTPSVEPEILRELGLNSTQIQFVKRKATPGKAAAGHSECLIKLDDYQSWIPTYVEASPFEDTVLQYSRREHGDYSEYVEHVLGGDSEGSPTVTGTNDRIPDQRQHTSNGKSDTERRGPESDSRNPTQP